MQKVIKWLNKHNIAFTEESKDSIIITLESGCVWVNGYGENMYYDKCINIIKNKYNRYFAVEVTGYSMSHVLCNTTRQDVIIDALKERLERD